ncbi:hypothetical protein BGZ76_010499 [Entomortierella beljakovae]|nr:hypothetical protein BGZ76_010499 [Entomortierella beljakovae]
MGAEWKREKVQDHKFDFINVEDFIDNSCWRQFRYMLVFVAIIRGILVYCSDIFTAVNLLSNPNANTFFKNDSLTIKDFNFKLPFEVYKWLFSACILIGFLLLGLEIRRSRAIIKSKDISYAFTSQIASRYYTVRSYPHYCFFSQINNSKKTVDEVAFFCFFTFRNWKRLILADAPRQVINASILYQIFQGRFRDGSFLRWGELFKNDILKMVSVGAMIFTVTVFALSSIMFLSAIILYIPLVSHIQGNLKEYCCHKIDKRIDELILKNTKNRALEAKTKAGKNDIAMGTFKQPTLPQVDLGAPSVPVKTPKSAYNTPNYSSHGGGNTYGQQQDYGYEQQMYGNQTGYGNGYNQDDYFQAAPTKNQRDKAFDPYADSAFTADDVYDAYGSNQDKQRLQQGSNDTDIYNDYYNNSSQATRTPRYDDYTYPPRSGSPLPSQHGSDLGSNHNGSNSGNNYSAGNNNRYGNDNNGTYGGYQNYGNDHYSSGNQNNNGTFSPAITPQRPRRQDTSRSNGRY